METGMARLAVYALLGTALTAAGEDASPPGDIPFPKALARSALTTAVLDDPLADALLLGNGDLNGLLFSEGDDLVIHLAKNDVWDARLDARLNPPLPTLGRLKELAFGEWADRNWILPEGSDWQGPDAYHAHPYPCPRPCARLRLRGAASGALLAKLDLERAVTDVYAASGRIRVFIDANNNALVCSLPKGVKAELDAIPVDGFPAPRQGAAASGRWIAQEIPGDADWPGMHFAAALAAEGDMATVAVVTSNEVNDTRQTAIELAQSIASRRFERVAASHSAAWRRFWSRSGIELYDRVLERVWYRNLYFLACVSKPGVVSTGLFAAPMDEAPAWHGDYHTNYNIQQTYWGAYGANHVELTEPYDRLITGYLPRARWLARQIYDMEGAFFPHVLFPYEPVNPERCKSPHGRQYIHHVWGFTLGVSGMTVQPLWWRYKYAPDIHYLRETAYPALRDVADFYADFVDQCEEHDGVVALAPTVSPEHHGWTTEFERNRDCAFCIAYFAATFDAAIKAAETLDRDEEQVSRWKKAKALLPPYPLHKGPPEVVVDVAGAEPIVYNIPVPATPVFPAEQITRETPVEVQGLFRRTISHLENNGNNAMVMLAAARARLGMEDAYDWLRREIDGRERPNGTLSFNVLDPRNGFNEFGHYTEMFGTVLPITEMLLQSSDGIVRTFPAWPDWLPASFARLRAVGGFLVSASQEQGRAAAITVESTVGGVLRLESLAPRLEVRASKESVWRDAPAPVGGVVEVEMKAGEVLHFRPRPVWEQVRAEGTVNAFAQENGDMVMRISGSPGASTGYLMAGLSARGGAGFLFRLPRPMGSISLNCIRPTAPIVRGGGNRRQTGPTTC